MPESHEPTDGTGPIDIALAIPVVEGKLLVGRRSAGRHLAGLWEFPGGKIEDGEEPRRAARRELEEETGLVAGTLEPLLVLVHDYPGRSLRFHVYLARDPAGRMPSGRVSSWVWKSLDELRGLDFPEANQPILRALRWRIEQ